MYRLISLAGATVLVAMASTPASAYGNAPWCLKAPLGFGTVQEICEFGNFQSCNAERPHFGNTAFCVQNSWYLPYWKGRGGVAPGHRHRAVRKRTHRHH